MANKNGISTGKGFNGKVPFAEQSDNAGKINNVAHLYQYSIYMHLSDAQIGLLDITFTMITNKNITDTASVISNMTENLPCAGVVKDNEGGGSFFATSITPYSNNKVTVYGSAIDNYGTVTSGMKDFDASKITTAIKKTTLF